MTSAQAAELQQDEQQHGSVAVLDGAVKESAPSPEQSGSQTHSQGALGLKMLAGGMRSSRALPSVLALQRMAGNRATSSLIGSMPAIQREVDVEEGIDRTGGALDTAGGHISQWSGMAGGLDGKVYQEGNTDTSGSTGGVTGSIIGGVAGVGSTAINAHKAIEASGTKTTEEGLGRGGWANWREAHRTHKTAGVNAVQSGISVGGQGVTAASGISQIAANAGSTSAFAGMNNLLGGIGGIIALPIQALSTMRTMRKAYKQWGRLDKLRRGLADHSASAKNHAKTLADREESLTAAQDWLTSCNSDLDELRDALRTKYPTIPKARGARIDRLMMVHDIADKEGIVHLAEVAVRDLTKERDDVAEAKAKAEQEIRDAHDRATTETENPDDIRAYAMRKNKAGFFKKIVSVVGGALGIGGGIAATVASFACIGATAAVGTAIAATPVGWALCGAAAVIALGLGGYAFWKWASKRYDRSRKAGESKLSSFFHAINPFSKKIGKSKRERLAERLYEYAHDATNPEHQRKAKETIDSLGLDWGALHMDDGTQKDAAIRLIHDKMGS